MVEIGNEENKMTKNNMKHGNKIIIMDDKNKEQYDYAQTLEFYNQKAYLENKADENDATIVQKFLKYGSIAFLILSLITFFSIHASSFKSIFDGTWETSYGWSMLRDVAICLGVFILWFGSIKLFFKVRSRNN